MFLIIRKVIQKFPFFNWKQLQWEPTKFGIGRQLLDSKTTLRPKDD